MSDKQKEKKAVDELRGSLFQNIIGQERAKKKAEFYIDSYLHTHVFPNAIFTAGRGQGKTTLARECAKGLVLFNEQGEVELMEDTKKPGRLRPRRKKFIEVNCSTLKNVKQFANSFLLPYVQDKDVTMFFDEASEIPSDISMALLTILNPNPENKNVFAVDDYVFEFDFRKQTFLFATSEPQKVNHALLDRLERIDLEDYSYPDLEKIVKKGAPDVDFKDNVLQEISPVLRGNARAAQMMADKIKIFLRNKKDFGVKQWKQMKDMLGIYPLGLNATEVLILNYLRQRTEGTSLTCLAAKTGLSRESVQKDYEMYLMKHNLLQITTAGREITARGLEYLKELEKQSSGSEVAH